MGNVVIPFARKKVLPLTVDPPHKDSHKDFTFAPHIFKRFEWEALKAFCQKYEVRQANLVIVFKKFLMHEEVFVRHFRVRTMDIRNCFVNTSKLIQEMTDVLLPTIFLKNFPGLEPVDDLAEMTFARLIINGYLFCRQSLPDLFYEFFAILRRNPELPVSAKVGLANLRQVGLLLLEDLQPCGTKTYLTRALQKLPEGDDTTLERMIRLGVKYPLLFFVLVRFRRQLRRCVLGDAFWAQDKHSRLFRVQCLDWRDDAEAALVASHQEWFANETAARAQSAHAILCDLADGPAYRLSDHMHPPLPEITTDLATTAKHRVGYVLARQLLLESNAALPPEGVTPFLAPYTSSATSSTKLKYDIASVSGPYALRELHGALAPLVPPDRLPAQSASPRRSPASPRRPRSQSPSKPAASLVEALPLAERVAGMKALAWRSLASAAAMPGVSAGASTGEGEGRPTDVLVVQELEDAETIPVDGQSLLPATQHQHPDQHPDQHPEEEEEEGDGDGQSAGSEEEYDDEEEEEEEFEELPALTAQHEGNLAGVLRLEDNALVRDAASSQRDFVFSTLTGRSRWVVRFADDHGNEVKQCVGY